MQVDLWYHGEYAYAKYLNFTIDGSDTKYTLHYYTYAGGTTGDSFYFQNGMQFTTYD